MKSGKQASPVCESEPSWQTFLDAEMSKPYFLTLNEHIEKRRGETKVFPLAEDVLTAFSLCPLQNVKVVILGQDPYHGANQAHGLCFSVQQGQKIPPSLRNIFKELAQDIEGFTEPGNGDLTAWAKQGVFLLNTVLTVEEGLANSHKSLGWETFTDASIKHISDTQQGVVFLLWGKPSQQKASLIDTSKHHVLESSHPSPLSAYRGFLGCKHFSETNKLLVSANQTPITWSL